MNCMWCFNDNRECQEGIQQEQLKDIYLQQRRNLVASTVSQFANRHVNEKKSLKRSSVASNLPLGEQYLMENRVATEKNVQLLSSRPFESTFQTSYKQIPLNLQIMRFKNEQKNGPFPNSEKPVGAHKMRMVENYRQNRQEYKHYNNRQSLPSSNQLNNVNLFHQPQRRALQPNLNILAQNQGNRQLAGPSLRRSQIIENKRKQKTTNLQKIVQEQFRKDLQKVFNDNKKINTNFKEQKKPVPKQQNHRQKHEIGQLQVPAANNPLMNSRLSRQLSSTHNIDDIMCTKTESIGQSSSSSSTSQIILSMSNLNKNKLMTNSSTNFGKNQPNQYHNQNQNQNQNQVMGNKLTESMKGFSKNKNKIKSFNDI